MGAAVVKIACNCALLLIKEDMGLAVGPSRFAVETKGGCALLQWDLQMAMEARPNLAAANLDASNAFDEIERDCIEAAIKANPYLHSLLPLFEMLYRKGAGELWYYDEAGNFVMGTKKCEESARVVSLGSSSSAYLWNRSTLACERPWGRKCLSSRTATTRTSWRSRTKWRRYCTRLRQSSAWLDFVSTLAKGRQS